MHIHTCTHTDSHVCQGICPCKKHMKCVQSFRGTRLHTHTHTHHYMVQARNLNKASVQITCIRAVFQPRREAQGKRGKTVGEPHTHAHTRAVTSARFAFISSRSAASCARSAASASCPACSSLACFAWAACVCAPPTAKPAWAGTVASRALFCAPATTHTGSGPHTSAQLRSVQPSSAVMQWHCRQPTSSCLHALWPPFKKGPLVA